MKRWLCLLWLGLATLVMGAESNSSRDLYWIAYGHVASAGPPRYMMQIDALGNVTVLPRRVVPMGSLGGSKISAVALAKDRADRIVLWTFGGLRNESPTLFRVVLSNPGLRYLGQTHFPAISTNSLVWLSVTQRPQTNALAVSMPADDGNSYLVGLRLASQFPNGKSQSLSQQPICESSIYPCQYQVGFGGTISSDGRFSLLADLRKLFIQQLDGKFNPVGKPVLLNSSPQPSVASSFYTGADITGPLPNMNRFVVYGTQTASGVGDSRPNHIWLQPVNAEGLKTGPRISIFTSLLADSGSGSNIAIDPPGRFVIYASDVSEKERNVLVFQALDGTGHPSGSHKVIARGVASLGGIDILEQ